MLLILSTCPVLDTSVNGGGVRLYQIWNSDSRQWNLKESC